MILRPKVLDYWGSLYDGKQGLEQRQLVKLVEPLFNRLTVFDPRWDGGGAPGRAPGGMGREQKRAPSGWRGASQVGGKKSPNWMGGRAPVPNQHWIAAHPTILESYHILTAPLLSLDRFPHGVRPVSGTRDPREARLVLHGRHRSHTDTISLSPLSLT